MNERDLFAAASAIADPDERAALLERECADRPELLQRIERLINSPLGVEGFSDSPAPGLSIKKSPPEIPPKQDESTRAERLKKFERFLAEPRTPWQQFSAFVAAHRFGAAVASAAILTLTLGTIWGVRKAIEDARRNAIAEIESLREREAASSRAESLAKERAAAESKARADRGKQQAVRVKAQSVEALRVATDEDVAKLIAAGRELTNRERVHLEAIARRWESMA